MDNTHVATQVEWVTKEEAGVLLGTIGRPLSTRRVLELAKEGRIESGRTRDPNNGQTVVRIHAGSIERFLEAKRNPQPVPVPESKDQPRGIRRQVPELVELLQMVRDGCADREPARLWLTMQECVDYSGLPARILVHLIETGRLPVMDVGRGSRGGRWRIRKVDLRSLGAAPLNSPDQLLAGAN